MDIPGRWAKAGRHRSDSRPATLWPTSSTLATSFVNLQIQSSPGSNNLYEYQPLETPNTQIRLLSIEPEDGTDTIATTLSTFSMAEAPQFTALSYAWGDYSQERLIMIDGRSKIVGQSCEYALWQLRARGLSQWYWIDAICIDQSNSLEKGRQVQAMPVIFGNASQVAISYGAGNDDISDLMAEAMHAHEEETAAGRELEQPRFPLGWQRDAVSESITIDSPDSVFSYASPTESWLSESSHRLYNAITDLGSRPYWSRLWIVQELTMARLTLALGESTCIPMHVLYRFCAELPRRLGRLQPEQDLSDLYKLPMMSLGLELGGYSAHGSEGRSVARDLLLPEALSKFGNRMCQDPKDRVYAVLSVVSWPAGKVELAADYGISSTELALRILDLVPSKLGKGNHDRHAAGEPWNLVCLLCKCLSIHLHHDEILEMISDRQEEYTSIAARVMPLCFSDSDSLHVGHSALPDLATLLATTSQYEFCTLLGSERTRDLWVPASTESGPSYHKTRADMHFACLESLNETDPAKSAFWKGEARPPRRLLRRVSGFLGLLPSAARRGDLLVRIRSQTLDSEFNAHVIVRRYGEIYGLIGTALLVPEATLRLSMHDELGRRRRPHSSRHVNTSRPSFTFQFDREDALALACLLREHKHLVLPRHSSTKGSWAESHWLSQAPERLKPLYTAVCHTPFSSYATLQPGAPTPSVEKPGWNWDLMASQ